MMLQSIPKELSTMLAKLLLQDLLDDRCVSDLTEYLSLSVTQADGATQISFTTTSSEPVTYTTVIPSAENVDLQSVVFVAQGDSMHYQ